MIPAETITKIQDALRIEEVIGDFVSLTRRGASYMACCPFHNEKTPSFVVTPSKGIFKCFGCGESGTAVSFLMKHENMSFVEAMKYLGRKYHIEVKEKEETAEELAQRQRTESLMIANEFAANYYAEQLKSGEGRNIGFAYFKSRGLEEDTIRRYGLGWSPSDRYAILREAAAKGHKEEYLVECGGLVKLDDGKVYDRFHDRVVFPIHSVSGRVIAFSCRTLHADNKAKYVNSPTTPLYVKEKALFGIYFAKSEMAKQKKCFLVEGNLDVISMHQKGILNTVASCGTALTSGQVQIIKRFVGENGTVTVMYDGDGAGIKAAVKAIKLILQEGLNVRLVLLPGGQDPDDFCRKNSLEQVQAFIAENEQDFISYRTSLLSQQAADDPIRRADLINEIADTIACIPDPVKQSVYIQECARKFAIGEDILRSRVGTAIQQMRLEEKKLRERQRSGSTGVPSDGAPLPPYPDDPSAYTGDFSSYDGSTSIAPDADRPSRRTAPKRMDKQVVAERSLLSYVLKYGRDLMHFPVTSHLYRPGEEPYSVFEFIDGCLVGDGIGFSDPASKRCYDAYGALFDAGEPQDVIQKRLMEGSDREVAALAEQLIIDRYALTMEALLSSMTSHQTLLVKYVPEELIKYNIVLLQKKRNELIKELNGTEGQQQKLEEIAQIADKIKKLKEEIKNLN
ncbi:MAG: DNA primase [Bacteroidales bacterium]|nr:DNA primase [Bacteroidales bacterium]